MRGEIRSLTLANMMCAAASPPPPSSPNPGNTNKQYDYLLKFLLVGDSDVGKEEILSGLSDGAAESPYGYSNGEIVCTLCSLCRCSSTAPSSWSAVTQDCNRIACCRVTVDSCVV